MDKNEIVALVIVAAAALLALRFFFGKKGGGCCGTGCLPKFDKKNETQKFEDKK